MRDKLYILFNIREEEAWTVGKMLLFSFFQGLGLAFLFTAANVLYLSKVDITTLPYVYIVTAVLMLALEAGYQRLEHIWSVGKIVLSILLVITASLVLFGLGLWIEHDATWILFLLIVWEKVAALTANSEFGKINAMIFDIRQSKRLFGLLGSAEIPARILGCLVAPFMLDFISTESLLFFSAFFFGISIIFYLQITQRHKAKLAMVIARGLSRLSSARKKSVSMSDLAISFFGSRYILLLGVFMFGIVCTSTFVEFSFLTQVESALDGQQKLALFLGIFLSIGELATFILKSFFSGRLINRFGIRFGLRLLPIGLLSLLIFFYISELFASQADLWIITFMMFYTGVTKSGLTDPAFFSLFQPLKQRIRFEAYNAVGIVENIAFGIAGLTLLAINGISMVTSIQPAIIFMSLLVFVLIGTWISSFFINKEYHKILEDALQNRSLSGGTMLQLTDTSAVETLRAHLKSNHIGEVLYSLDLLLKFEHSSLKEEIPLLLQHRESEIRLATLKGIEKHKLQRFGLDVKQRALEDANPRVRSVALSVYGAIAEEDFVEEMIPLLESENEDIRAGVMIALIKYGGISGVIAAGEKLINLVNSENEKHRKFAAYIVGEVGIQNFYQPLIRLMADQSDDVVKVALDAAGKIQNARLVTSLIEKLNEPKVFESAGRSLIRMGKVTLPYLDRMLEDASIGENLNKLRRGVYVSGRIGGGHAIAILKNKIKMAYPEVRRQVLESLSTMNYKALPKEEIEINSIIEEEVKEAIFILYAIERLKNANTGILLVSALNYELEQSIGRCLILLSFIYPSKMLKQVRENIFIGEREKRANAIEMLDIVLPNKTKQIIFPLLEDMPNSLRLEHLSNIYPYDPVNLQAIIQRLLSPTALFINAWTRSVALYLSREHRLWEVTKENVALLDHYHPMVKETAAWVLHETNYPLFGEIRMNTFQPQQRELMENIHENLGDEQHHKLFQVEKVLLLKTVSIFSNTSEEMLSEIAAIATEEEVSANETIFHKGDEGDCMYIIYKGKVRIHDGDHTFAEFGERDIFGELSLLDPEPRSASVTALNDTLLLRLNQETFYEIMADRIEVVKGILRILVRRLRHQNSILAKYDNPAG